MACLQELVQNIDRPALVFDDCHKVILRNSIETPAYNLFGPHVLGKTLPDFFPSNQASVLHNFCLKALELKEPCIHQLQLISPDGPSELTARMIPIFNLSSMSWNLILTLQKKAAGGIETLVDKPASPGRSEENKAKANGSGVAEDLKVALRLMLKEGATQIAELKEEISARLPHEIMLIVEALKKSRLNKEQRSYVELLESNAKKLTNPFTRRISNPFYKLSPKEIRIASLIRNGKTNKEIAKLLKLSKSTILTHRHHLRTKLGLKNKKQNLQSYLNSFGMQPPSDRQELSQLDFKA